MKESEFPWLFFFLFLSVVPSQLLAFLWLPSSSRHKKRSQMYVKKNPNLEAERWRPWELFLFLFEWKEWKERERERDKEEKERR